MQQRGRVSHQNINFLVRRMIDMNARDNGHIHLKRAAESARKHLRDGSILMAGRRQQLNPGETGSFPGRQAHRLARHRMYGYGRFRKRNRADMVPLPASDRNLDVIADRTDPHP